MKEWNKAIFTGNCPVNEVTGDGIHVGRCWFSLKDGKVCPRHGDVSEAVKYYELTGSLYSETKLNRWKNECNKSKNG
jgi:hypothetical protein